MAGVFCEIESFSTLLWLDISPLLQLELLIVVFILLEISVWGAPSSACRKLRTLQGESNSNNAKPKTGNMVFNAFMFNFSFTKQTYKIVENENVIFFLMKFLN